MRYWFHIINGSVAGLHWVWAQAIDQMPDYWPPDLVKRDRASGIEAGSGDYFIARKKPTRFHSTDGRQPPELTGDQSGDSSDHHDTIVWWNLHDWEFQGSITNQHKETKHYQCIATHYVMIGGGKCRKETFNVINIDMSGASVSYLMDWAQEHFLHATPRMVSTINLNSPRSDVYSGEFEHWDTNFTFRFGEWQTYQSITEIGTYTNGSASRFESAYVDAWERLPNAACNTMANILEAIGTIKTAIESLHNPVKAVGEFAKDLADPRNAWLAYRYQYSTTKLDVEEYVSLWRRLRKLKNMCKHASVRVYGTFDDETGSYTCSCRVMVSAILPDGLDDLLSMCGLRVNASNLWDMVPYSFVVDWFIKLGSILEAFENWTYSMTLQPVELWYTCKTSYDAQTVYYRVRGSSLGVLPAYHERQVQGRTIKMRIADTISLFT